MRCAFVQSVQEGGQPLLTGPALCGLCPPQSSASGHASHLMVHRVPAASAALPLVLQAAGGPDAECLNMGTYGWGLTEIFSLPSGETSATEFLLGKPFHCAFTTLSPHWRAPTL